MCPKPLEVTRTSLTTCYTSLCDSSCRNTYCLSKSLLVKHWWCLTSTPWTPSTSSPSTSHLHSSMAVKYNAVSLRHKHSPEILFIHRKHFIYYVPAFICNARQLIQHIRLFLSSKILFSKISFFQNFVSFHFISFYFILFYFIFKKKFVMNSVHEQCPKSDSETVLSPKTGWVYQVPSPASTPRCAQALPGARVAVSWRPQRRVAVHRLPCRKPQPAVAVSWPCAARPAWPCRGLAVLYCDTAQPCLAPFSHNTPECIAILTSSATNRLSHDTNFVS